MSLQVIGAGLGRTGTLSLKVALEQLGFLSCYHMAEVIMQPARVQDWLDAANGTPNWERTFAGFTATVDYPGCRYWRELVAAYPDAKVILSVRDPDKWFESTQATIFSEQSLEHFRIPQLSEFFQRNVFAEFGDKIHDRDFMVAAFKRHNDEVRRVIPPARLLVFEAKQGWVPLCEFLGVPVPATPFPHTNSREEMAAMMAAAEGAAKAGHATDITVEGMSAMVRQRLESLRRPS